MATDARRRHLLLYALAAAAAPAVTMRRVSFAAPGQSLSADFPRQDPDSVRAVVGASHFDIDRVRELVNRQPALAKAAIDWGFGDWESALGAASHTGRREIAELLLAHGARPTIFSAAMMGQLGVVRAFVEAAPGIQGTPGPHGISLMQHAIAGGDSAAPVRDYLQRVGGAETRKTAGPPEGNAPYRGRYGLEVEPSTRVVVDEHRRGHLQIAVGEGTPRGLAWIDRAEFHPAGAPHVRVSFRLDGGLAVALTIRDGELEVSARRV